MTSTIQRPGKRMVVLLAALALSLLALFHRARLQTWAYGVGTGVELSRGKAAPEIPGSAATLGGAPVRLADRHGRVVLLHFFTFG